VSSWRVTIQASRPGIQQLSPILRHPGIVRNRASGSGYRAKPSLRLRRRDILKSRYFNDWPLFCWIVAVNTLAVIGYMTTQDLTVPLGLSEMIQGSVRVCVPLLFVAFAASSMTELAPRPFRTWLMRNRRYFGLGFAAGMAWQMFFILWLAIAHPDYYAKEVFSGVPDFIIYRLGPYLFLVAMTITSFLPVRKKLNRKAWFALH